MEENSNAQNEDEDPTDNQGNLIQGDEKEDKKSMLPINFVSFFHIIEK